MFHNFFSKKIFLYFFSKLLYAVQLQLFLTLVSLPILIAWGLPLSMMSIVGNIIFVPFLTIFLLISSFVFFSQLVAIPNCWLISILEYITHIWSWLIFCSKQQWLIGCAKPSVPVAALLSSVSLVIIYLQRKCRPLVITSTFFILLSLLLLFFKLYAYQTLLIKKIPCNGGFVTLINTSGVITLIDPGVLGKRVNDTWIDYTLQKELVEQCGATHIDTIIITRPSLLTLQYSAQMCHVLKVARVYLNLWQGQADKKMLRYYGKCRYELQKKEGVLLRIGSKSVIYQLPAGYSLVLTPLDEKLHYKDIRFVRIHISLRDEKNNELYAEVSS